MYVRPKGPTIVSVTIAVDGSVKTATVAQSSGVNSLDEAAVNCIAEHWHFHPAIQNGKPVEVTKTYLIKWQVQ